MNYNTTLAFGIVAAMLAATMTFATSTTVLATSDNDRNDFGEGASHLGQTDQMGEHSSDPEDDGASDPDDRVGIGNVFNQGDPKEDDADPPDSKHPADTANRLCPEDSDDPLCP